MRTVALLTIPVLAFFASSACFAADSAPVSYYPQACVEGLKRDPSDIDAPHWEAHPLLTRVSNHAPPTELHILRSRTNVWMRRAPCDARRAALVIGIGAEYSLDPDPTAITMPRLSAVQNGKTAELQAIRLDGGSVIPTGANGFNPYRYTDGTTQSVLVTNDATVDLNRAFTLTIEDALVPYGTTSLQIPDYAPTPETYPLAFGPRRINGRYAGNFFDPAKPGEGIVVEIGDADAATDTHYLQFSWHSFDNNGKPFWISGGQSFLDGAKHLHMPAVFRGGGRFGGVAIADELTQWGTVDIEFSDCNTAIIDYAANGKLPADVPSGSGHLQWQRLTSTSGFACE